MTATNGKEAHLASENRRLRSRTFLPSAGRLGRGLAMTLLATSIAFAGVACSGSGGDNANGSVPTLETSGYQAAYLTSPKEKPDLVLQDTSGNTFDLKKETEGFVTLLFVGYTSCPDICPLHMSNVASTLADMPADQVEHIKVVFITSDPARDTPEALREWLDLFDPMIIGLVPTEEQLSEVTTKLSMNPIQTHDLGNGEYSVDHAAYILAFGANEDVARIGFLGGMEQEIYDHDIPLLVEETVES